MNKTHTNKVIIVQMFCLSCRELKKSKNELSARLNVHWTNNVYKITCFIKCIIKTKTMIFINSKQIFKDMRFYIMKTKAIQLNSLMLETIYIFYTYIPLTK